MRSVATAHFSLVSRLALTSGIRLLCEKIELIVDRPFRRLTRRQLVPRQHLVHALPNHLGIVAFEIRVRLVPLLVAPQQVWKMLLQKRKEYLLRAGLQEQRAGAKGRCSVGDGRRANRLNALLTIVNKR